MKLTQQELLALGPEARAQIARELGRQKQSKYRSIAETINGIRFDSRKEARRYGELTALQKAGKIRELKLQPQFTLQEAFTTPEGKRIRAIIYRADFSYLDEAGRLHVEDVKSPATRTREYLMKAKMLREKYGITVEEI